MSIDLAFYLHDGDELIACLVDTCMSSDRIGCEPWSDTPTSLAAYETTLRRELADEIAQLEPDERLEYDADPDNFYTFAGDKLKQLENATRIAEKHADKGFSLQAKWY